MPTWEPWSALCWEWWRLPLIYMIGLSPGVAAGTNVGVTAISSLVGGWTHFREGRLDHRLLVTIGIPSVIGSFAGGFLGSAIPAWVILAAVAVALLWQGAVFLIQGRRESREGDGGDSQIPTPRRSLPLEITLGMGIGFLGSLVGLALGVIRLPAMVQLLRVYPPIAVGTNLTINFVSALFAIVWTALFRTGGLHSAWGYGACSRRGGLLRSQGNRKNKPGLAENSHRRGAGTGLSSGALSGHPGIPRLTAGSCAHASSSSSRSQGAPRSCW